MTYDGQTGMVLPRQDAVALFDEGRARTFAYYEKQGWLAEVGYAAEEPARTEW